MWSPNDKMDSPQYPAEEHYYQSEKIKPLPPFYRLHGWKIATSILAVIVVSLLLYMLLTPKQSTQPVIQVIPVTGVLTATPAQIVPTPTLAPTQPPMVAILTGTWQGQGTYNPGEPSSTPFDMLLTITNVYGNSFTGTLEEDIYNSTVSVSGVITGTVGNSVKITFTTNSYITSGRMQLHCTYMATVANGEMTGVWTYPGNSSPDGTLSLSKKS